MSEELMRVLIHRLDKIESNLDILVQKHVVKDWYTTEEVAEILGRVEFTVRE